MNCKNNFFIQKKEISSEKVNLNIELTFYGKIYVKKNCLCRNHLGVVILSTVINQ